MPRVFIPPLLRPLADGRAEVDVQAGTVREIINELDRRFLGIGERLLDRGELRSGLTVSIDGRVSSLGLLEKVGPDSEVHFLPAIGGG